MKPRFKPRTKKERKYILFDHLIELQKNWQINGNGWFYETYGGGMEAAINQLGYEEEFKQYKQTKS